MRVWMYEMIYNEIEGVLVVFTLTTGVRGLGELSVRNIQPGPVLVVRDGVGMAYMGRPFAPYLSLGVFLSRSINLGSPMVSPGGDPVVLGFSKSCLGMRRAAYVRWRFGSHARRAVVVGHT